MLSKLVKEDGDFPPRTKAKSGVGYAAEYIEDTAEDMVK